MSGPSIDQVAGKTFSVQDFRAMVNYENTTNRGYVRSATGKDGGVVLEKVSKHWFSIPFHSFRSRTDQFYNAQMRSKLVEALASDMKYVGEGGNRLKALADRVLYKPGEAKTGRTDSLARTEVAEVLAEFDRQFNSAAGRRNIVNNLVAKLATEAGYPDVEVFKREALRLEPGSDELRAYFAETEEVDAKGEKVTEHGHVKMQKSEVEFRGFLHLLEARATEARLVNEANSSIIEDVKALLAEGTEQTVISENVKARLLGALETALRAEINQLSSDPNAGPDVAQGYLQAFVNEVVPAAILQAKDELKALGIDPQTHPAEVEAYVNDHAGAKGLVAMAKNFFAQAIVGYQHRDEWARQLQDDFGGGRKLNDGLLSVFKAGRTSTYVKNVAWTSIEGGKRKEFLQEVLGGFDRAFDLSKAETLRDLFVKSFLVANYGDDPSEKVDVVEKLIDRMHDLGKNVETALKINLGERIEVNGEKEDSSSMTKRVQQIGEDCIKSLQEFGISDWTINQLLTRTLPKIINQSIVRNRESDTSMFYGENDLSGVLKRLYATGKSIDRLWNEKLNASYQKSCKQAEKFIKSMAKRQNWPVQDLMKEIQASFRQEYLAMAEKAIAEFLDDEVYNLDNREIAERDLMAKFEACREELMGNVNTRLRAYAFTRTVGSGREDVSNGFANAYRELETLNAELKGDRRLSASEVRQLASGSLSRKWNEIVLRNLPRHDRKERFDDALVGRIKAEFAKVAKAEIEKVADVRQKVREGLAATCRDFVEYSVGNENGMLHLYASLTRPGETKPDSRAIAELKRKAGDYLILRNREHADEIVERFIRNPNASAKRGRIEEQLQQLMDLNGKAELEYGLRLYHNQHAIGVEKQMNAVFVGGRMVAPELEDSVLAEVDGKSAFNTDFGKAERDYVLAKTFGAEHGKMLDHVKRFPLAYSTATDEFIRQVSEYNARLIEKAAKEYAEARNGMLAAFKPIGEGYGLPEQDKREVLEFVLGGIATANRERLETGREPVTVEEAKAYYDKQLFNRLNRIANEKFDEFKEVLAAITRAYDRVMPEVKDLFSVEDLKTKFSPAVPEEVIAKFSAKMLKDYVERLNIRLTVDFSKDPKLDSLDYSIRVHEEVRELIDRVVADVSAWAVDQTRDKFATVTVVNLVDMSGDFAAETNKSDIYNLLCANLKPWGASEAVRAKTAAIMDAIVEESWAKDVVGEENFVESEALTAMKRELLADLSETTKKIVRSVFQSKFDQTQVAGALALVDRFVRDGWQFSDDGQTAAMIREVVIRRIHDLETRDEIGEDTVVLDFDFSGNGLGTLEKINDIVNGQGVIEKVINERGNRIAEMVNATVISTYPELFDPNREGLTELEKSAVITNTMKLGVYVKLAVHDACRRYIDEQGKFHDAMVNLEELNAEVEREFETTQAPMLAKCMARMKSAAELPGVIRETTDRLIASLNERIAKRLPAEKRVRIGGDWSTQELNRYGDELTQQRIDAFFGYVREEFEKRMKLLGGEAFDQAASGEILRGMFANTVDEFIGDMVKSEPPPALVKLDIETKRGFFSDTSWVDVFVDSLKGK